MSCKKNYRRTPQVLRRIYEGGTKDMNDVTSGDLPPTRTQLPEATSLSPSSPPVPEHVSPQVAPTGLPASAIRRVRLKAAEQFWYVLECVAFAAGYFQKVSDKKALSEAGLADMTGAERFWYIVLCIPFGGAYFRKVITKKALSDAGQIALTSGENTWYIVLCVWFGAGYFAKIPVKRAFEDAALGEMTSAEKFWYILQCIAFGAGYFAKLPVKKALSEMLPAVVTIK